MKMAQVFFNAKSMFNFFPEFQQNMKILNLVKEICQLHHSMYYQKAE